MNILIVHQNFPGQFPHIADALVARGDRVVAIGGPTSKGRPGVDLKRWANTRDSTPDIFTPATRAEADLIRAHAALGVAYALADGGFRPDAIIGHPGWGETIHLRSAFPAARQILLGELYYRAKGVDVGFDPEFERPQRVIEARTNAKNATGALAYTMADRIICPTPFQAWTFPAIFQPSITVLHEGVDVQAARRRPDAVVKLPGNRRIDRMTPVITFINRNLERLRGFHIFMRALPAIQAALPDVEVLVIGGEDGRPYGGAPPGGGGWRAHMLAEVGDRLDPKRLHFLGRVTHRAMIDALSISRAHIYYTYPFVLSWSLLEAMACECPIIASDTAPVRDAMTDGETGVLRDFFDVDALAAATIDAVRHPETFDAMRANARARAVERYDRATVGVPGWLRIIDELAAA